MAIGITLAVAGFGYWALVAATLAGPAVTTGAGVGDHQVGFPDDRAATPKSCRCCLLAES